MARQSPRARQWHGVPAGSNTLRVTNREHPKLKTPGVAYPLQRAWRICGFPINFGNHLALRLERRRRRPFFACVPRPARVMPRLGPGSRRLFAPTAQGLRHYGHRTSQAFVAMLAQSRRKAGRSSNAPVELNKMSVSGCARKVGATSLPLN